MKILELNGLKAGYGGQFYLDGIDLKIEKGEIIGIIGPNGSGKTTLLRAVSRILKPESGRVSLNGQNIWQMRMNDFAQKVAVVSQQPEAVDMKVREYVLMGRLPYLKAFQFYETRKDEKIADHYLYLTGISELKDKLFLEISGGERQLAQIARALTQEPEVLLLDEPTSHLDIKHQVEILDLIRRFNKDLGITIVMVMHDLNLAAEYCGRLLMMNNGKAARLGTPEEVLTYQQIEEVYQTVVIVRNNPLSLKPYVFLVSEEEKIKSNSQGNPVQIRS